MEEESEYALRKWHQMPKHPVSVDCFKSDIGTNIQMGIEKKRCVNIVYHGLNEPETSRIIEPVEFFKRGNENYVHAYCQLEEEMRTFRIDRISQAKLTEQSCEVLYREPITYRKDSATTMHESQYNSNRGYSLIRVLLPYIVFALFLIVLLFYRSK